MKTIPPPCPEPESGQKYWRSLDQLADAPEFRQWLEREFPDGASELTDPVSRRSFVKLMSASFALGGLGFLGTGCRRPEEKILPFGKAPEGYIHGVPQYFATAMPTRGSAIPLVVKSSDGRPTKIEGNPDHPDSNGATDTFAQASLLSLYDPDRARRYVQGGITISREKALDELSRFSKQLAANAGAKTAFLLEQSSSPSRRRLVSMLQVKLREAKWAIYEPVDLHANRRVTGDVPNFKVDQAKAILSLDCDFIGGEADAHRLIRGFSAGRRIQKATDSMNRLYAVEGLMTLTGMNSDHRLRVATSQVATVAAHVAARVAPQNQQIAALVAKLPLSSLLGPFDPTNADAKKKAEDRQKFLEGWIAECATDLLANRGASLVLAGHRQTQAVHVLAKLLNTELGNISKTVLYSAVPETPTNTDLPALAASLRAGQVDTLVILGGNPVYNAPADLKWSEAQTKAKEIIRLGTYEDETFAATSQSQSQSALHLPQAHYLESWGDAATSDGTTVSIQPLIAPIFDGLTELEVLARLAGLDVTKPHDIVRDTLRGSAPGPNFEETWKKFLHDGFMPGAQPITSDRPLSAGEVTQAFAPLAPVALSKESLEVVFHRDHRMDDGRWNNNGWLQEFPDPVTKATWDGLILISRKTAAEFDVKNTTTSKTTTDIVKVTLQVGGETKSITGPIWITPGMADNSIGLALGYGRKKSPQGGTGRVGHNVGLYNAYEIRTSSTMGFATGAKLEKTGERYVLAVTQEHGAMEGRPIIREANKAQYEKFPKFANNFDLEAHSEFIPKDEKTGRPKGIYEHPYEAFEKRKSMNGVNLEGKHVKSEIHQWGMSVDLNQCVGCGACVLACQAENNVPIVGKDQVKRNREMHWLRIDRYFSGAGDTLDEMVDDPQAVHQPMMCQHCENAPCESVCPVNATVHDDEGVNIMAYNRCVGTRYCSNNCAWKVRRFNFLDFNRRSLDQLVGTRYSSPMVGKTEGEWTLKRWWKNPDIGTRPQDEWDLLKLVRNPDVTVRMRGVMEKCNFCVQRIEQGKIAQKVKAGQSGDVRVPDGVIRPACQQVCPAEAIVFGNQLDPNSKVSQLQKSERNYEVLGFLETRPRVTYLARIRNPNPKMPDYHEISLNLKPYVDRNGNPYEPQGHGASHDAEKKGAH
jgi:molybdopterin-containing oxidoreductase family iron-sulfur binding subunit